MLTQPREKLTHFPRQTVLGILKNPRQISSYCSASFLDRQTVFNQEGADLIDNGSALTDQTVADAVDGLQIQLIGVDLGTTKRMDGRVTASAIAAASLKSFFCPLRYGLRAKCWDPGQASIPASRQVRNKLHQLATI
jgi:hypothetical protein